jgi:superfamily II RNA helicase
MSKYTDDVLKFSKEIRESMIKLQNEELDYKKTKSDEIKEAAKAIGYLVNMDIPNPPRSQEYFHYEVASQGNNSSRDWSRLLDLLNSEDLEIVDSVSDQYRIHYILRRNK